MVATMSIASPTSLSSCEGGCQWVRRARWFERGSNHCGIYEGGCILSKSGERETSGTVSTLYEIVSTFGASRWIFEMFHKAELALVRSCF